MLKMRFVLPLLATLVLLGCPKKEPAAQATPTEDAECVPPGLQCLGDVIATCAMTGGAKGFGHYWKFSPCPGCSISKDAPQCTSVTAGTFCKQDWPARCGGPDGKTIFRCEEKKWTAQACPGGCSATADDWSCNQ
jgi:hypothetical protein